MKIVCSSLLIVLLAFGGCTNKKPPQSLPKTKSSQISFEVRAIQKEIGGCDVSEEYCSRIEMKYPLMKNGPENIISSLNAKILEALLQTVALQELNELPSEALLHSVADSFLLEWQASAELDPDAALSAGWFVKVEGELGLMTPKVAVVSLAVSSYAGGVHPNSYLVLLNFNLSTGQLLEWSDIISDMASLMKKAEEKFKEARRLSPEADLADSGFFWGEAFALPMNFELQLDGVLFWYNPYEAASYAEGPTEFHISYEELGLIFKKELVF